MTMDFSELAEVALKARQNSYSPYSGYAVGAALLGKSGRVYTGCNIENAAFSPTVCAERVAFFKAVSEDESGFIAIAIAGGRTDGEQLEYCYPCGVCRQVMREFCDDDFAVISVRGRDDYLYQTLGDLLPNSFGPKDME